MNHIRGLLQLFISYIWAFLQGWGGHSDAKWEIFQCFVNFSKMSFRMGGYVIPF